MPEVSPVTVLMESEGISSVVSRLPSIRHCGQRPSNESGRSAVPHLEQIRSLVFILLIPETNSEKGNNFRRTGRTAGLLRRTEQNGYLRLVRHAARFGDNHRRVRLWPARRLPGVNVPGFHSSNLGIDWARVATASSSSHSFDSLLRYQRSRTSRGNASMFGKRRPESATSRFSASGSPQRMANR